MIGNKNRSKETSQSAPDDFDKALDWEASRIAMNERSERRAWRIMWVVAGLLVLSWVAIVLMMPLKQTVPYVIRVDNATGVPDIVTRLNTKDMAFDEVMDKYWVASYVRARENYDWYSLQEDYERVGMLSSAIVGKEYAAQYGGDNGIDKKLANHTRKVVEILSVVPSGKGTATVRYRVSTGPVDGSSPPAVTGWVATVSYEYKNPSLMPESYRYVNPFGFQVVSYRNDPEFVGGAK